MSHVQSIMGIMHHSDNIYNIVKHKKMLWCMIIKCMI